MNYHWWQKFKMNKYLYLFSLLFFLYSCNSCNEQKKNAPVIKVDEEKAEEIKIDLKVKRLETSLLETSPEEIAAKIPSIKKEYGSFFTVFSRNLINIGPPENTAFPGYLKDFISDKYIREIYGEVKKKYPDFAPYKTGFENAFKYYKALFPSRSIPELVTFISGFNYAVVTTDSVLGIGLDMFLGQDCKYYSLLGMPQYKIHTMGPDMMVADGMRSWISTEFEQKLPKEDLLSLMIEEGKYMFVMDNVLPEAADSIKIGFSAQQLEWCERSEGSVWKYIVDQKLLFSSNYKENIKFLKEAPFTTGLPRESPGRIGVWVGWQIVKNYMKNNPDVTIEELMKDTDSQKILNKSRYKPQIPKA